MVKKIIKKHQRLLATLSVIAITIYSFFVFWGYLTSQDYRPPLFHVCLCLILIVVFSVFMATRHPARKTSREKTDENSGGKLISSDLKISILNSVLLFTSIILLGIVVSKKEIFETLFLKSGIYSEIEWGLHYDYIFSALLLIIIRCYLGALSLPYNLIKISLNTLRFVFILTSIALPFSRFPYISVSAVLSASVLSLVFDTLLSSIQPEKE